MNNFEFGMNVPRRAIYFYCLARKQKRFSTHVNNSQIQIQSLFCYICASTKE
jgi:hypothetical protein